MVVGHALLAPPLSLAQAVHERLAAQTGFWGLALHVTFAPHSLQAPALHAGACGPKHWALAPPAPLLPSQATHVAVAVLQEAVAPAQAGKKAPAAAPQMPPAPHFPRAALLQLPSSTQASAKTKVPAA